jgi:serine/threonine-protein kinase ULK4
MNNYHIYEEVGRGKYSVVYKGRVKKSIKYVAVKSVERSRRRKLMNEVRIFHDLNHKNVLRFYNWYETRNHLWIIFEYCAGGDLYQMIEQDKKLPEDTVRKFAFELVEGLSYLHSNGIIYADLKPSNILINEYGVLKYADFGLSKKISDYNGTQDSQAALATGSQGEAGRSKAGTPYYMAPELFHDQGVHSFASDFWSLGCLLFELATGRPPFHSNSLKELITQIVESDISPLPVEGASPEFNELLSRMLERDPVKRAGWEEVSGHRYWGEGVHVGKRQYPQQTQFEAYLRLRGIVPEHYYDQRNNPLVRKLGNSTAGSQAKVDILRLSHNVRRNMKREQDDDDSGSSSGNPSNQYSGIPSTGPSPSTSTGSHQHYL